MSHLITSLQQGFKLNSQKLISEREREREYTTNRKPNMLIVIHQDEASTQHLAYTSMTHAV